MELQDERAPEEKKTHTVLIGGTDRFMSGWGKADGGKSYAFWACRDEDAKRVTEWVESRSDMKRVRQVSSDYRPSGKGHCHIYVVGPNHAAVSRGQ